MPVQNLTCNLGKETRHGVEDLVVEGMAVRFPTDERIGPGVISVVTDRMLSGSPPGLKLPQPLIFRFGSPEAKASAPLPDAQSDCFPHCDIIGPELLVLPVGRPVFVDRFSPVMKADCPGDILAFIGSQRNKPETPRNHMFVYFLEKKNRLRRKPVFLPGQAVQPIKFPNRFLCRGPFNGHPLLDRLPDVPFCAVPKFCFHRFFRTCEIQDVTEVR